MKRIIVLLMAMAASGSAAIAQNQWTLSQCIDYALEHSITIQQSSNNLEQKEIALNTAMNSRLPGVSASSGQNFSFGRGLTADNTYANTNTTSTSFSVGADVPVFQGFRIKYNIANSRLDLASATMDLEKAKDDIRVAVAQAFVQILYNKEISAVAQNQVEIDENQVMRIAEMVKNGKASRAELSAQEASLAQSHLSATQARNNLSLAVLELTQLLELPSPDGFDVEVPGVSSLYLDELFSPEEIYAQAVSVKPAVRAEELRLESSELGVDIAKASKLPTISLSGGLGSNYYTSSSSFKTTSFKDQISNNFSQYLGLSLSIPVFSRFQTRNQIRNATVSVKNQELQLERTRKTLYKEIQQAYYNAVAAQTKYRSSESAAMSAEDAFALVQAKYEIGKATVTEFNESKARYVSAESDFVQAKYQCLYQSKLLDFYRGLDLNF